MKIFLSFDNSTTSGGGQSILRYVQSHPDEKDLVVFCPPGKLASECEKYADVFTFNLRDSLFVNTKKLRSIFRKLPANSEISALGISTIPLVFLSTLGIRIKKTFTEHLLTKEYRLEGNLRHNIQSIAYFFLIRMFSHIYCVSEAVQNHITSKFLFPKSKTSVVYNVVPQLRYSPIKHSRSKKIKLISVGAITYTKNHDFLIDLFELIPKTYTLDIFGEGPLRKSLIKKLEKSKLDERIKFHGSVRHEEIVEKMSESDIYVHSSRSESFGYTIAEAMAVGLPVVAFKVGGIPEVMKDNRTGYLVEPFDLEQFAKYVIKLGGTPKLRNEFGNNGFKYLDKFSRTPFEDSVPSGY